MKSCVVLAALVSLACLATAEVFLEEKFADGE